MGNGIDADSTIDDDAVRGESTLGDGWGHGVG
jgi:hypothetical protein